MSSISIPSLEDVSGYIFNYLNIIFEKYKTPFETALFGWCPIKNKYYIFHYHPEQDEKHKEIQVKKIRKEIFTDLKKKDFVYLGCHRENIKSKIQAAFNGNDIPGRPLSRIPRYIIEDYIQDDNYPEIGGNLQLGIANKYGFKPFVLCKPRNIGQPDAYLSYLGIDFIAQVYCTASSKSSKFKATAVSKIFLSTVQICKSVRI